MSLCVCGCTQIEGLKLLDVEGDTESLEPRHVALIDEAYGKRQCASDRMTER